MRFAVVTVLSLLLSAAADAATPPLGRAVPVSAPEYGPTTSEKASSSIATDGDSFFVVWSDQRRSPSRHVYGTRISADGRVLDPAGIPFGRGDAPAVVATSGGYALAWHAYDGYYAAAYFGGTVRVARLGSTNSECAGAQVASNGSTILVATCGRDLFLLDRNLSVLKQMKLATPMWHISSLAVTTLGDEYLTAVTSRNHTYPLVTQKVDGAGTLHAPVQVAGARGTDSVAMASRGSEVLAVWRELSNIVGRLLPRDENSTERRTVAAADINLPHPDRALYSPAIAWRGSEYVTMYMRGGYERPRELFLGRVDEAGTQIGTPVLIPAGTGARDRPDIAAKDDGSGAAAWVDANWSVRVGFFDSASIATATPFHTIIHAASGANEQVLPAIERVGGHAVIAWLDRSIGISNVRVARAGGAPLLVASNTNAHWVDVNSDGNTVWVAWAGDGTLGVRRYTAGLTPIDAEPRLIDPPARASVAVAGAAGGGALAVIWRTAPVDYSAADLVATVVRPGGSIAEVAISGDTEGAEESTVAVWDGTRFFVGWRYHVYPLMDPPWPLPAPIRARHVTVAGEAVESEPFELFVTDTFSEGLKAAASPQGIVLGWTEYGNESGIGLRLARYTGTAPLVPSAPLPARGYFGDIAALANGEVDVYWWNSDFEVAWIQYERFSSTLQSQGDPFKTEPFPASDQTVALAATVIDSRPVVIHTQVDDSGAATGISRLVVRQTVPGRRRSVR
jgi:hypothetical protein